MRWIAKRGPGADLQVEVTSVLAEGLGVDGGEVDLALVLESEGLQLLVRTPRAPRESQRRCMREEGQRPCIRAVGLGADLTNERGRGDLGEIADGVRIEGLGEDVLAVVKGLVED